MLAMVAVLVVVAVPADCADRGFYIGAGLGAPSFEVNEYYEDFSYLFFEDDTPGFRFFGGYRILKYLGVEATYIDFGTIKKHETTAYRHDNELKVGIDSWDASVVGMVPLGEKISLFGKAGFASWNADVRVQDGDEVQDLSRDGTDFTFGAGLDFVFKHMGLRIELDWLTMSDTDGAFMASGNLTYNF